MAPKKKVTGLIKLQIQAGAANPAPPIGPALGQHGVNIMEFCKAYNAATESQRGNVIPVEITVYEDRSFDFILNTVAAPHDLDALLVQLKSDGTMCLVGVTAEPHPAPSVGNLVFRRRALAGSLIGGIKETQEMLDFCAEHNIVSDIEVILVQKVNEAYHHFFFHYDATPLLVVETSQIDLRAPHRSDRHEPEIPG